MSKTILFANILVTNYCIFETQGRTVACATMLLHRAQPHALSFLPHYTSQVWARPRSQPVPVTSWGCRASGVPSTIRPSPEPQDGCPRPASIPEGSPHPWPSRTTWPHATPCTMAEPQPWGTVALVNQHCPGCVGRGWSPHLRITLGGLKWHYGCFLDY